MENLNIPQHVAIILDGNGRWAKKRHLPRNMGHRQGSKVVEKIIEDAHDLGIKYLTVYAFQQRIGTPTGRSKCIDETAS